MVKISFAMNLFKGGGPRNVYSLVRVLVENGYEAKILSFSDPRFALTGGDVTPDSYAVGVPYLLPSKYITIAESFIQLTESFPMISGTAIPLSMRQDRTFQTHHCGWALNPSRQVSLSAFEQATIILDFFNISLRHMLSRNSFLR